MRQNKPCLGYFCQVFHHSDGKTNTVQKKSWLPRLSSADPDGFWLGFLWLGFITWAPGFKTNYRLSSSLDGLHYKCVIYHFRVSYVPSIVMGEGLDFSHTYTTAPLMVGRRQREYERKSFVPRYNLQRYVYSELLPPTRPYLLNTHSMRIHQWINPNPLINIVILRSKICWNLSSYNPFPDNTQSRASLLP